LNERTARASRIVLALNPALRSATAVDLIRCLVSGAGSELLGVFVEDVGLLEHARSRLAREVLLSGKERPLDTSTLSRQLRAQAQQVRNDFEAVARELGMPHSFQSARGEIVSELGLRAAKAETTIVTSAAAAPARAWRSALEKLLPERSGAVLIAREGWHTGSTILAVVEDAADRALLTARQIAEKSRSPISLILSGAAAEKAAGFDTRYADVSIAAAELKADAIVTAARRMLTRIVVIPLRYATRDAGLIEALLAGTNSAVLIVK
jgi:hypothetical protein